MVTNDPNKAKREALAREVEEFLSKGGKVKKVPEGERVIPEWVHKEAAINDENVYERNRKFMKRRSRR